LDPSFPPALSRIIEAYEQLGKFDEALASVQKLLQNTTDRRIGLRPLARIYARMGKRREAEEVLPTIEKNGTSGGDEFALAAIYSALGDRDHAIAALERGVQRRSLMAFVFTDPQFDSLRSDLRFQQLLRRAGLPSQLRNSYPEAGFEENEPVLAIWSCGRGGRGERDGVSRAPSHKRIVARSGATATPANASG
jgi:tetratricopeptide (TPR) repeat protein